MTPMLRVRLGEAVNFIRSRSFNPVVARFCVGVLSLVLFSAVMSAQTADKKEIVKQARQSYYSLIGQGLVEFKCTTVPNWKLLLAEQKLDADTVDRTVELLNKIHFSVSLAAGGDAKVTHNDISAENEQMAKGLGQIYSGMEQMTTGFFQTWSVFSMSPALPEIGGDYQLQKTGAEYRLTYKDGTADVI